MMLRIRLEVARVELLVEISAPVVSEAVEAAMNSFEKTVASQHLRPSARVVRCWTPKCFNRPWSQIPFLSDQLQDPIVSWDHPLRRLSHIVCSCGNCAHILPDVVCLDSYPYQTTANTVPENSNTE